MSNDFSFDPNEFMHSTVNEVFADRRTPIDDKEYDNAYIKPGSIQFRGGVSEKGNKWLKVSMFVTITDQEQAEKTGLQEPGAGYEFFLDVSQDDGKTLLSGPNRNTDLGNLRKVLGQEAAPWNFGMLDGAGPMRIRVKHVPNRDDATKVRAEVAAVSKQS